MEDTFAKLKFKATKASGFSSALFPISVAGLGMKMHNLRSKFGFSFYGMSLDVKNEKADEWMHEESYRTVAEEILKFITAKNGRIYFKKIRDASLRESIAFKEYVEKLMPKISAMNERELTDTYSTFVSSYAYYWSLGFITFLYEGSLSERLSRSIAKRYENAADVTGQLLKNTYTSFMIENENRLLTIKNAPRNRQKELARQYLKDFFFIDANYISAPIPTLLSVLKKANRVHIQTSSGRFSKNAHIRVTKEEHLIAELLKLTEILRDRRKYVNLLGSYTMFRFLDEGLKRSRLPRKLARRMFWFEFKDLIFDSARLKRRLMNRKSASVIFSRDNELYLEYAALEELRPLSKITELAGTPASKGRITGKVKIIIGLKDFYKLKEGDILVTEMTRPEFVPIMHKAGAILTDEGGLTCHAAIVARELRKPCIVGTKFGTRILKDGDLVEVDANRGKVKIIKKS